jgi:hypothetical protein
MHRHVHGGDRWTKPKFVQHVRDTVGLGTEKEYTDVSVSINDPRNALDFYVRFACVSCTPTTCTWRGTASYIGSAKTAIIRTSASSRHGDFALRKGKAGLTATEKWRVREFLHHQPNYRIQLLMTHLFDHGLNPKEERSVGFLLGNAAHSQALVRRIPW